MPSSLLTLCLSLAHATPVGVPPPGSEPEPVEPPDDAPLPTVDELLAEPAPAQAPDPDTAPLPGEQVALPPVRPIEEPEPRLQYEVYVRGRYVSVPQGFMDLFFTGSRNDGWPLVADRPSLEGAAYGVEFDMINQKKGVGQFYIEFLQGFMEEGYWDDEDKPNTFIDGDWLRPSNLIGAVIVGVNGAYDAPIVRFDQTKDRFAMSFQFGGGLGIAAIVGDFEQWGQGVKNTPTGITSYPAYERVADGDASDGKLDLGSPVWPVPDLNFAFRFNIMDRFVFRLEGGLHGGLYYGAALGGHF